MDLQDWDDGPLSKQVKVYLDAGELSDAADVAGNHMQQMTMFMYSRGNNARMTDGSIGRLLGMYSTYPVGLVNLMHHLATVGDKKLSPNKIAAYSTMLAVWAGTTVAMSEVFDADAARWTVWNGMFYRGGPYTELGYNAAYVGAAIAQGKVDDDPVAQLFMDRIGRQIGRQLIPGTAGAIHWYKAAEALTNGDLQLASRELMGLPQTEAGKSPRAPQGAYNPKSPF
jgi:hypothetical protein